MINSNITKDTLYTKARDTFHQWSDARGAYLIYSAVLSPCSLPSIFYDLFRFGLNFSTAQEADAFAAAFENAKGMRIKREQREESGV